MYEIIKFIFPKTYWRIYNEGEKNSATKVEYKKHEFVPISEKSALKLPLTFRYKKPSYGSNNSQPPMTVH